MKFKVLIFQAGAFISPIAVIYQQSKPIHITLWSEIIFKLLTDELNSRYTLLISFFRQFICHGYQKGCVLQEPWL